MTRAKNKGPGKPAPLDQAAIAIEFARVTGRDERDARRFAHHIGSLAREVPAPIYSTKERRAILRRAATAFLNAAEALGELDGVSVIEMLAQVSACRRDLNPPVCRPEPESEEVWARRADGTLEVVRKSAFLGRGMYEFGRHGLPEKPTIFRNYEYAATLVDMIQDLSLLHAGASRAAKGNVGPTINSRALLADNLLATFAVFGIVATGSPDGLAAFCMTEILTARGDAGSGLDALQKAIARRNSENGPKN